MSSTVRPTNVLERCRGLWRRFTRRPDQGGTSGSGVRIGAVSYLNTRPLIQGLAEPARAVHYDLPSRLADRLSAGDLDVALVPVVEVFQGRGHLVVSDACIACRGPVRSVKLLFRSPPGDVRTLALDEGSRTSATLARVLLARRFGVRPSISPLKIGRRVDSDRSDAVLIIGDRALGPPRGRFVEVWDLGQEWVSWTGLPFVFAVWAARRSFAHPAPGESPERLDTLARLLSRARDLGLERLGDIAREEAAPHGLSVEDCLTYLRDNLHYRLGDSEREAMRLFHRLSLEEGLVQPGCEWDTFDAAGVEVA